MTDNLELKDYFNIINDEIQIKQHQIENIKPNFFPVIAIIIGFIASSTITTVKSDITAFWYFLGIITIFFLSINKFLIHRRLFITRNNDLIREQKEYPIFTRLLRKYYAQIYFPLLEGFFLIAIFGFIESFLFPSASDQISTIFKDFLIWIVAFSFFLFLLIEIYRKLFKMIKNKRDEIIFSEWLSRHSTWFENVTFTYGMYSVLLFGGIILLIWKDLDVKNFGFELILIIILVGMWSILIQMINCSKIVENETRKLIYLNDLKEKILYSDLSNDEINQKFSIINITKLESVPLFLFFSYYYYSFNKPLLEKFGSDSIEQFINFGRIDQVPLESKKIL